MKRYDIDLGIEAVNLRNARLDLDELIRCEGFGSAGFGVLTQIANTMHGVEARLEGASLNAADDDHAAEVAKLREIVRGLVEDCNAHHSSMCRSWKFGVKQCDCHYGLARQALGEGK